MSAAPSHLAAKAAAALIAIAAGISLLGSAVGAEPIEVGVSLSTGAVVLDTPVRPGDEVDLPPVSVLNPGGVTSTYHLTVVPEISGTAHSVPADWVVLDRDEVRVAPGGAEPFRTHLAVPASAEAGRYQVVVASTVAPDDEGGASTGAATGVRISFEVAGSAESAGRAERTAPTTDPYAAPRGGLAAPALLLGAAVLTGLVWVVLRRRRRDAGEVAP